MTQLELDFAPPESPIEEAAQRARQRVIDGLVDAWGRVRPDGPRAPPLTPAQQRAYDAYRERRGAARGR